MISWCWCMDSLYWYFLFNIDVQRVARIDLEVVIVLKVNVEVVSVHALLQTGNVIQMFVEIVGSGELWLWLSFFLVLLLNSVQWEKNWCMPVPKSISKKHWKDILILLGTLAVNFVCYGSSVLGKDYVNFAVIWLNLVSNRVWRSYMIPYHHY